MQKQAPTLGRVLIMATFTLSCFGLLLYLWSAFGGPVPLKPRGYQFTASFAEATQLAQEADVRISGVTVGKVKKIELGDDGRTEATLEIEEKYAPVPSDSRGILRQKTLLGETYIEMTPGTKGAPLLAEGGQSGDEERRIDRRAGRDLPLLRREDAPGVPGLAAGGGGQGITERRRQLLRRARVTSSRSRSTPTRCSKILNSQSARDEATDQEHRRVLQGADRAGDQALAELIINSNNVFGTTARRDQRDQRDLHRAADLHRGVEEDAAARSSPTRRTRTR